MNHQTDSKPNNKPHFDFIDLIKGVCILSVLYFHTIPDSTPALSIIRMPLYFFLSGIFFSIYDSYKTFIIKKANNLIIPFIFFFSTSLICSICIAYIKKDYTDLEIHNIFDEHLSINTPIWFLISLFEVNIIYYCISKLTSKSTIQTIIVAFISLTSFYLSLKHINLNIYIDTSFSALIFFHFGSIIKRYNFRFHTSSKFDIPISIFLLTIFIYLANLLKSISLLNNDIGNNYLLYLASTITGISFLFFFCRRINRINAINYLGKYSIIILGLHYPLMKIIFHFFNWEIQYGLWVYIILILLFYPLIYLIKHIIPELVAQKPLLPIVNKKMIFNPIIINNILHIRSKKALFCYLPRSFQQNKD